jgi:hypothetical protein
MDALSQVGKLRPRRPIVPDTGVKVLLDSDMVRDIDRGLSSCLTGGAVEVIVVCDSGGIE